MEARSIAFASNVDDILYELDRKNRAPLQSLAQFLLLSGGDNQAKFVKGELIVESPSPAATPIAKLVELTIQRGEHENAIFFGRRLHRIV
jgi:hypothetical protein